MPNTLERRITALERRDDPRAHWRMPLTIHIDPRWCAERREQAIAEAHERAGRPWPDPRPWEPGMPARVVLIMRAVVEAG